MGGYENNPILLDKVPSDFQFGLYDLDYSVFDTHIEGAIKLCPTFGRAGIKSTICGPESFTPDHKPIMVSEKKLKVKFCVFRVFRAQTPIYPVCFTRAATIVPA
jgi:sarcosine dehydrogenase